MTDDDIWQVIAGEKLILTAGAIDAHVHYICPQLWEEVGFAGGSRAATRS